MWYNSAMNLLLIDTDELTVSYLEHIKKAKAYNIIATDYTLEQYQKNAIDIVIVDSSIEKNRLFCEKIVELNPKQKILIISDLLCPLNNVVCEECVGLYNKKRLLKPIEVKEFVEIIDNFDNYTCKYIPTNNFRDIVPILDDILRQFPNYKYDHESLTIYSTSKKQNHQKLKEELEIIEILNSHNVGYTIVDDINIKIKAE